MARSRNAWLTPDDTAQPNTIARCLAIPEPLFPMVTGALSLLTEVWNWEQFGTMTPEDAAHLATVMLDEFSEDCGMNCDELLLCLARSPLNSTIPDDAQLRVANGVPQYSYDGTNWLDVYGDVNAQPIGRPLVATSGATADARICLAATRATLVLAETYKGVYGAIAADIYNTANRFANWLNGFNRWLSGIVWPDAAWITQSEALRAHALPTNYAAGELTAQQIQDLLCLIVTHASDNAGIVTFDWGAIRDNAISELGLNPGTAIWSIIVYLKNRGLEIASVTPITDIPLDCDCSEPLEMVIKETDVNWNGLDADISYDAVNNWWYYTGKLFNSGGSYYLPMFGRLANGLFYITQLEVVSGEGPVTNANHRHDQDGIWYYNSNPTGNNRAMYRMRWRIINWSTGIKTYRFRVSLA